MTLWEEIQEMEEGVFNEDSNEDLEGRILEIYLKHFLGEDLEEVVKNDAAKKSELI